MLTRAGPEPLEKPRRFYQAADAALDGPGLWTVRLDSRVAKTPAGARLMLPTQPLARAVAAEWDAPSEVIDFGRMPLTRMAFTAIDRTPSTRDAIVSEAVKFAESDLLCYLAEGPRALSERQARVWRPELDWADRALGLALIPVAGITHQRQPPESLARGRALAAELDDFRLTGLAFAAGLFGSTVLAFAVERGRLTGEAAFDLSRLDEAFQQEHWGVDAEAADRTTGMHREAVAVGRWFELLGSG